MYHQLLLDREGCFISGNAVKESDGTNYVTTEIPFDSEFFAASDARLEQVIDTLHQANITLLKITGLDSPQEIAKKIEENETAINRRIMHTISLLKTSVKEE